MQNVKMYQARDITYSLVLNFITYVIVQEAKFLLEIRQVKFGFQFQSS